MIGSFLNVTIVRLPNDQSLIRPRSRCPKCETPIAWYDNIPVVSWIALGGRCRKCRERISLQYPIVEILTAGIWLAAAWYYGLTVTALQGAVFGTLLLGIAVTDAKHYLIPDEYTWGGLVLGLLFALLGGPAAVADAAIGAAVGFGLLYFVGWAGEKLLHKEAMGGGDIKMMAMVGSFVGWQGVLLTIFGGALLGTVIFVPLAMRSGRLVPFGVFLAAAAAATFVFGEVVWMWYWSLIGG
jgi:leader peptidase (prepilin peptidase)/N-methyltransferase